MRMLAWRAPAWRTTFVTDSRSASARADSYATGNAGRSAWTMVSTPGRGKRPPRAVQLTAEPLGAVADHRGPNLGKRLAADALDVPHLVTCASRLILRQARRELGFHDDHRQRVAKEIVQVARDALSLGERGEPLDLLVGAPQATLRPLAFGIEEARGAGHDRENEGGRRGPGSATVVGRAR